MVTLVFTSCQAPIADGFVEELVRYVAERLGIATILRDDIAWQAREQQLDAGLIDVAWICGLPYIWKADQQDPAVELLAAPVMAGARYQHQPVYYSDVVVHRASRFHSFADLRGAVWAYNEPHSHSGYNVVRAALAEMGEIDGYFDKVIEAGAHQHALVLIRDRQVDAAAIDSTVLELACVADVSLAVQLRVVASLGPSPIPPWVIGKHVPAVLRDELRMLLVEMHTDRVGRSVLARGQVERFVAVTDGNYDAIRSMARAAAEVRLARMVETSDRSAAPV